MSNGRIESGGIILQAQGAEDRLLVEGYGDGGFRLLGRRFDGGVIVLPSGVYPVTAKTVTELDISDFGRLLSADPKPELVLIGTGTAMALVPSAVRDALGQAGVGCDMMDTGAAARTYNVLLMEDRHVAALLLPVD
ncbi:Mth938-like domain-containing protein [Eilatimonas milleporae]|uniref:Mth938-like domain-containing protein n=1 Tax=Eilatimonas milleporae TaxID=911205 RepID=A0A3M0CE57_9PROT|nr:MTH938/NDUFAF3 family protein [Eilatimonas milleporae]RMB05026.1 uncharacterized protein BXY39_2604 [Eilatimonas milleporae]